MTIPLKEQPSDRVLALDGFRGLAVLMVTFYRFGEVSLTESVVGKWASKAIYIGASGVDLFFVLSGFLITGILVAQKGRSHYFSSFYARRALRIFPLYFASLLCFLWLLPWFGNDLVLTGGNIPWGPNAIHGNTIHLWLYTTNLSIAWANEWQFGALDHFWSLAIEEQFYLLWPVIVLFLSRQRLVLVCLIACVFFVVSRIGFAFVSELDVTSKTFTLFRVEGLILGALVALAIPKRTVYTPQFCRRLRIGLIVLGVLYALTLPLGQYDYTIRYTIVSLAAALLLLCALNLDGRAVERKVLENAILRSFGKYSYAMYIFQLPLIPLLAAWISPASCEYVVGNRLLGTFLYVAMMFAVTYGLSVLSWYLFESRILQLRDRYFRHQSGSADEKAHGRPRVSDDDNVARHPS